MPLFIKVAIFFWCIFSIQFSWLHKRSIKINIILCDRCYLQNCTSIAFEKIANHTKYKKPNVPSHLNFFWRNFDKANRNFLHPFQLMGEINFWQNAASGNKYFPSAYRVWWQELGGKFQVRRCMSKSVSIQCIFQECELHKFGNFLHTWWNINIWEKI